MSQGRKGGFADAEIKVPYAKENIQLTKSPFFFSFFQKSEANQNRIAPDRSLLEKRRDQNTVWNLSGYQLRKWLEKGCPKPMLRVCTEPSIAPVNTLGYHIVVRSKTCEERGWGGEGVAAVGGGGGGRERGHWGPFYSTGQHSATCTLRATLSGTFLQILPDLVTPLNGALFISPQLSTEAVSALRKVWVLIKLQALVYDILPSTTAVFSYTIGSRKLSANEQFFVGA